MNLVKFPKVVVFFGCKGSGKSTMADVVTKHYGHKQHAFASRLKQICKDVWGFSDEDLYGSSESREREYTEFPLSGDCLKCGLKMLVTEGIASKGWSCLPCGAFFPLHVTPRVALETLGTEWGRRLFPGVWAFSTLRTAVECPDPVVIADGRFANELDTCVMKGAYRVGLRRGLNAAPTTTHRSEMEPRELIATRQLDFDLIIPDGLSIEESSTILRRGLESAESKRMVMRAVLEEEV